MVVIRDFSGEAAVTLRERLEAMAAEQRRGLDPAIRRVFDCATESVAASGVAGEALQVGEVAPEVELADAEGRRVCTEPLLAAGPVVVTFYRGGWCPYCNLALRALQDSLPGIRAAGAELVAISPERPERMRETTARNGVTFATLHDDGNRAARLFGLLHEVPEDLAAVFRRLGLDLDEINGTAGWTLPLPATYVVDPDAVAVWAFIDPDPSRRAEPADIVAALHDLRAARPGAGDAAQEAPASGGTPARSQR